MAGGRARHERPSKIRGIPAAQSGFYTARFLRATIGRLLLWMFRVRVCGAENVPDGPAILAGNHISYGDPVLIWCQAPRPIHFMAKSGLWDGRFLGFALDHLWAFPVHRETADREAIKRATDLLAAGELVGIFPEGTRNLDGSAVPQGGVALIAVRAGVPVVPVGIAGTEAIRPPGVHTIRFPKVTISYGRPIVVEQAHGEGRKRIVESLTEDIWVRIGEELDRARGACEA